MQRVVDLELSLRLNPAQPPEEFRSAETRYQGYRLAPRRASLEASAQSDAKPRSKLKVLRPLPLSKLKRELEPGILFLATDGPAVR